MTVTPLDDSHARDLYLSDSDDLSSNRRAVDYRGYTVAARVKQAVEHPHKYVNVRVATRTGSLLYNNGERAADTTEIERALERMLAEAKTVVDDRAEANQVAGTGMLDTIREVFGDE